eukprot:TRINITY_DN3486_c0_g2_i1.p1 TRINITY_DN3486_c0_g2~~TRINITY_DN3486_c0_g2_i1.p1  ORF type:complete len:896 (-),score=89.22 TRINITY_DN3486_c0_g2_i1:1620-4307(-)
MDTFGKEICNHVDILSCIISRLSNSLSSVCRLALSSSTLQTHVSAALRSVVINTISEAHFVASPKVIGVSSLAVSARFPPFELDQIKGIISSQCEWNHVVRLCIHHSHVEALLPSLTSSFVNLETLIVEEPFLPEIRYSDKSKQIWKFSRLCKKLKRLVVPPSALFPILRENTSLPDFIQSVRLECPDQLKSLGNLFVWLHGAVPVPFWWIGSALPKGCSVENCIKALDYLDDINIQFEGGDTILSHLIRLEEFFNPDEHLQLVKAILERGGDPIRPVTLGDGTVTNALQLSAAAPLTENVPAVFEILLDAAISSGGLKYGNVEGLISSQGHSPLHLACRGSFKQIQLVHVKLTQDLGLNFLDHDMCIGGETPLLVSCRNLASYFISPPLHRPSPSILAFVQLGANICATSTEGQSILDQLFRLAIPEADAEPLMEAFIRHKVPVSIDPKDIHPSWITRAAALPDSPVRALVSRSIPQQNSSIAWTQALLSTRSSELTADSIRWLIANGADINFVNPLAQCEREGPVVLNSTPIMAISCHSPDLVPFLIELGADPLLTPHGTSLLDVLCLQCSGAGNESWNKITFDLCLRFMESGYVSLVARSLKHSRGTQKTSPIFQDLFLDILNPAGKWIDQICQDTLAAEASLIQTLFPVELLERMSDADHLACVQKLWNHVSPTFLELNPGILYLALGMASTSRPQILWLVNELLRLPATQWHHFNPMFDRCVNMLATDRGRLSLDVVCSVFEKFALLDDPPPFHASPLICMIPGPRILQAALSNPKCLPCETIPLDFLMRTVHPNPRLENLKLLFHDPKCRRLDRSLVVFVGIQALANHSVGSAPPEVVVDAFIEVFVYAFDNDIDRQHLIHGKTFEEHYADFVPDASCRSDKIINCLRG